jgi:excinuclease ABC subunit C
LGVAATVLKDLDIEGVDIISLAKEGRGGETDKGGDHVYIVGKKNPIYISRWPDVLFLLQRVRDEAHRFAVTYHRRLKSGRDFQSVLDAIPGIGASKKKALLKSFGDIRKIREASVDALQKADGIGRYMAAKIHAFLMEQAGE